MLSVFVYNKSKAKKRDVLNDNLIFRKVLGTTSWKFNQNIFILVLGVFGVTNYESELKSPKFKMADRIWQIRMQKVTWLGWNSELGRFGTADYESKLKMQKFKIWDPIWWTKMQNFLDWNKIWYSGVFKIANYDSEVNIQKFQT